MKKILCPTDFSEAAHNAIAYAAKLAQTLHCDLTLLNVQSIFGFSPLEIIQGNQVTPKTIAHQLEVQSQEITKVFKISCYPEVETTFHTLSSVIQKKSKGYDLIVMGTNGTDDLYQFFAGSNAYNAIIKSETPLLLVPDGCLYSEVKSIVYAYDYLRERKLPLGGLIPFTSALKADLTILQIMEEARSKEAEDDLKELQFIIRASHGNDVQFKYDTIHAAKVAESIIKYVQGNDIDILALCSAHRNVVEKLFHKSVIENISRSIKSPVYIFHQ